MSIIIQKYEEYKDFVNRHPQEIKRGEELARMGTMFFPVSKLGSYSEVINEGLYATLGSIGSFHAHLLHGSKASDKSLKGKIMLGLKMLLTFLSHIEVTAEIGIRQFLGKSLCNRFIITTEWLKVSLRLIILLWKRHKSKMTMLLSGAQYQPLSAAAGNPSQPEETALSPSDAEIVGEVNEQGEEIQEQPKQITKKSVIWVGKRSGKKIRLPEELGALSNIENISLDTNSANYNEATANGVPSEKADTWLNLLGELLHIFRPVVYLHLLRRNVTPWFAWFISVAMDLTSMRLTMMSLLATNSSVCTSGEEDFGTKEVLQRMWHQIFAFSTKYDYAKAENFGLKQSEITAEISRRRMLLLLYVMRTPFYEKYTLLWGKKLQKLVKSFPFLENLDNPVVDMLNYYHNAHFYISGS